MEALIFGNASYKYIDNIIVLFDTSGISSINKVATESEREKVLCEMLPDRVRIDYMRFIKGGFYSGDNYDIFYSKIKKSKIGHISYFMSVMLVKLLSLFKRNLRFVKDFPLLLR